MVADKIEPALTPEEWTLVRESDSGGSPTECAWLIAVNNAALPDSDPRKITRKKLDDVREAARTQLAALARSGEDVVAKRVIEFADALESYLPPET